MYNRYIPEETSFTPVPPSHGTPAGERSRGQPVSFRLPEFLSGREGGLFKGGEGLSGLLKSFHLDNLDSGDILLLLILLYLLVEGDDMDLVIALGLVLLMGLGDHES